MSDNSLEAICERHLSRHFPKQPSLTALLDHVTKFGPGEGTDTLDAALHLNDSQRNILVGAIERMRKSAKKARYA